MRRLALGSMLWFACTHSETGVEVTLPPGPFFATVGEPFQLAFESAKGTNVTWTVGNQAPVTQSEPEAIEVRFDAPGHVPVYVEATDDEGGRAQASATVYVTHPPATMPLRSAGSVAVSEGRVYVTLPDFNRIAVVEGEVVTHVPTCDHPTTVDVLNSVLAVACSASDQLQRIDLSTGETETVDLPWGARPYGILWLEDGRIAATLQGTGEVVWVSRDGDIERRTVGLDVRGLARKGDTLLVSRHRSPESGGAWYTVRPEETIGHSLAWDPGPDSDGDARGLPTYLQHIAIRPDGLVAHFSGLKANVERGFFNEGQAFTEESTVRSDMRQVHLTEAEWGVEGMPLTLDNRDRVAASAFHPRGHVLVVVTAGSQSLEVVDPYSMRVLGGALQVGHGIRGIAVEDTGMIWVDAELSRELVRYTLKETQLSPEPVRIPLTTGLDEPLAADVLAGKKLFYDASDTRLTSQGYIACASCHLDGDSDGRTWDFTDRGEGVRNTPSLIGVSQSGLLHWSANFDEVQDFEHDIRDVQDGEGLMADADFEECDATLGAPKAGRSEALDQLAAYVNHLNAFPRSPYRQADGGFSSEAQEGRRIFESEATGCLECHQGPAYTDSGWGPDDQPILHDVGTLTDASGQRLGEPLLGLDTPTLLGIHATPPYGHRGQAQTLDELWKDRSQVEHGRVDHLSSEEFAALLRFLLELEGPID